jgi:photosystem II stability/assembly factor-like uncharacterized protein
MKNISLIISIVLIGILNSYAQYYKEPSDTNISTIGTNFYQNYSPSASDSNEGSNFSMYKKWENFWMQKLAPTGSFKLATQAINTYSTNYTPPNVGNNQQNGSGWQELGPSNNNPNGIGRVNTIAFDPANSSIMYAGAADGGVWKTTNGGQSWGVTGTDKQLPRLCISDIAVDPQNSNYIYAATGDIDYNYCTSDGIYRSTDGGTTWAPINSGLFSNTNYNRLIGKLLIHPSNSGIMYAATSDGIYKTTNRNAGAPTWTKIYPATGNEFFKNVIFDPSNANTLYASGTNIYKSTNSGTNWTGIATGGNGLNMATAFSPESVHRINIAISQNSTLVYAYIVTGNATSDLNSHIYSYNISSNAWTYKSTLDIVSGGVGNVGRMAITVDPSNSQRLILGSVDFYYSTDGGSTLMSDRYNLTHADHHIFKFKPGSSTTVFTGCDGGVFELNVASWDVNMTSTSRNGGLGMQLLLKVQVLLLGKSVC